MTQMKDSEKEQIRKEGDAPQKFCVSAPDHTKYLLRIAGDGERSVSEDMFRMQQKAAAAGIPMSRPVEMGTWGKEEYILETWIDGTNAERAMPGLPEARQYAYGLEAGRILRKLHSIPVPEIGETAEPMICRRLEEKLQAYREEPEKYEKAYMFAEFLNENLSLLEKRPRSCLHGDCHPGNMIISRSGRLFFIGFSRSFYGDPWEEFRYIGRCVRNSPLFSSGMINGYFDGDVPEKFWKVLLTYISAGLLSSMYRTVPCMGERENALAGEAEKVLAWYDNLRNPVPSWYVKGYCRQSVAGVPFYLKSPYDFSFLREYGTVFQVFDRQNSGNICFGTEKDGRRYFIKFAGAPTCRGTGTPEEVMDRLKAAVTVYRDLNHKNLAELVEAREMGGGFAMVFRWAEGVCMGKSYPASHRRFMELPLADRMTVFRDILSFLEYTASRKYVAVDFYDSSVLYDRQQGKTTICDIDFFRKQPCVNDMGRMWGSSFFQSPEEFQLGAVLDEVTNVYTAGAAAFALFGGYDHAWNRWQLNRRSYETAAEAVCADRSRRQQSVRQFREEWENALE